MKAEVAERFTREFGGAVRDVVKVKAWNVTPSLGTVLQLDQPKGGAAFVWLPYPADGEAIPDIALQYPGESGRHSNTYPSPGLGRGLPALKLTIRTRDELEQTVKYIRAMKAKLPLPDVKASEENAKDATACVVDVGAMPAVVEPKPRREAISRTVQREVWQRDGGRCVECSTKEKLCFDHIVPFSRGGSNTVRNLQLLCERCNLSKGNRI